MEHRHLETEIEYIKKAIEELKQQDQRTEDAHTKKFEELEDKLDTALAQLGMYRHFTIFLRAVLIGVIMIVTLKFGDIKDLFVGVEVINETKR